MNPSPYITFPTPPFPYYLESGYRLYPIGETHPNRHHLGVYDLIYVCSGTLPIGEEDTRYELSSGDALILSPDRWHYSLRPCEVETAFYWVHFRSHESVEENIQEHGGRSLPIKLPKQWRASDPDLMKRLMAKLVNLTTESRTVAYWEEQQTFWELLRLMNDGGQLASSSQSMTVASQTEAFIKQNFQRDLTNESLSEVMHFHPNYLARCMKEVYGVTPLEFLQRYRIDQAKMLLLKTEWSMPRIAEHVGFHFTPYFSRTFKKRVGISPLAYRKQYQG
jgi:AraC-like DNA-binding protein